MTRRFIILTATIVFVVGFAVSLLFIHHAKGIIKSEIERRGSILVKAVAKSAIEAFQTPDLERNLEGVIKSLEQDPDVAIAMVIGTDGRILAHSDSQKVSRLLFLSQWEQGVFKSSEPKIRFDPQANRYLIGLAIFGPRSYQEGSSKLVIPTGESAISLGAIFIGVSQDRISKRTKETIKFVLLSLSGLLVATLIASILTTRRIIRPLKALTRATFQIAQGNLTAQVNISGRDEIGQLAKSFNTMTRKLQETTVSKRELEAIVEQKTNALKEVNITLLEANTHLQELQSLESRFVSMASHELRTPLTSIQGFVSLMLKYYERLSKDQMLNYCKAVSDESSRLTRMINEILDLKRMEQGCIELHPKKLDLRALAKSVIGELSIRSNQPHYQVNFADGELLVFVDQDKIKQIFINLLSNAAKYTPQDKTVTIEGFLINKTVVINVRDEGPGIPRDLWEKLFHPFARANDAVARKTIGSGLGLAITKSLVETMGGRIRAENLSTGAQFTVVLPKGEAPNDTNQKGSRCR